ncbi:MAG: hypothetical protein HN837_08175, partial [Chloroflexi bacterium]|nr:hypothetical protein [Chloroflexota bacterium]
MISNHNVLIVENDDNVLGILSRALQGEGYSVCPAHGGYESVALAFNTQFNVALIDTLIQPTGWVETVRQLNK